MPQTTSTPVRAPLVRRPLAETRTERPECLTRVVHKETDKGPEKVSVAAFQSSV